MTPSLLEIATLKEPETFRTGGRIKTMRRKRRSGNERGVKTGADEDKKQRKPQMKPSQHRRRKRRRRHRGSIRSWRTRRGRSRRREGSQGAPTVWKKRVGGDQIQYARPQLGRPNRQGGADGIQTRDQSFDPDSMLYVLDSDGSGWVSKEEARPLDARRTDAKSRKEGKMMAGMPYISPGAFRDMRSVLSAGW